MTYKWTKTKFPGVRFRTHQKRKHGVQYDRYFAIRYQRDGRRKEEGLGWSSGGWTAEKAANELGELKKAHTLGTGPVRLEEKRELEKARREQEEQDRKQAEINGLTFGEFFEKSYLPLSKQNKKPRSWGREKDHFELWIKPVLAAVPLREIVPLSLEPIKQNMQNAKQSPRSIEYCFATLRQAWNMAKRDALVKEDSPTKKIKTPKFDNKRQRYLTIDECNRLMPELKKRSQQLHDISLLSLDCGLRAGEIFSLEWQDIDLDRGALTLRDTKSTRTRTAFMTEEVRKMLEEKPGPPAGLVFRNRRGRMINKISNSFAESADKIGLNDGVKDSRYRVVFHSLRHTYASRLIEHGGADLYAVKELLGHSSLSVTERYAHLTENSLKDAIRRMEAHLHEQPRVIESSQEEIK